MTSAGLYCDGKQLVIDLQSHVFPERCVKTNQEVPADGKLLVPLVSKRLPLKRSGWHEDLRVASSGNAVTMEPWGQAGSFTVPLLLPLSSKWQRQQKSLLGNWLAYGGLLLGIVSGVTFVIYINADWFWVPAIFVVLAMVIGLSGAVMMTTKTSSLLAITQLEDGKLWVTGAHPDWLAELPRWQMPLAMLDRHILMAKVGKWIGWGIAGLFGIGFLFAAWLGISSYVYLQSVKTWPTVEGRIVISGVTEQTFFAKRRGWKTTYAVEVTYSYAVEDQSFTGKTSFSFGDEKAAGGALYSQYSVDEPITVRYNPANPSQSAVNLFDAETAQVIGAVLGGTMLLVGLIMLWFGAREASRQRMLQAEREANLAA